MLLPSDQFVNTKSSIAKIGYYEGSIRYYCTKILTRRQLSGFDGWILLSGILGDILGLYVLTKIKPETEVLSRSCDWIWKSECFGRGSWKRCQTGLCLCLLSFYCKSSHIFILVWYLNVVPKQLFSMICILFFLFICYTKHYSMPCSEWKDGPNPRPTLWIAITPFHLSFVSPSKWWDCFDFPLSFQIVCATPSVSWLLLKNSQINSVAVIDKQTHQVSKW